MAAMGQMRRHHLHRRSAEHVKTPGQISTAASNACCAIRSANDVTFKVTRA